MSNLSHRLYRWLRPYFYDLGVLHLLRRLISTRRRWVLADRLGLAGFQIVEATGHRLPAARARTLAAPRRVRRIDGLNLAGDLRADTGLSEVTRQTLTALRAASLGVSYTEIVVGPPSRSQPVADGLPAGAPYDVSLVDVLFFQFYDRMMEAPPELLAGKYVIAYWAWELPRFPALSRTTYKLMDEIWVYSGFVRDSLSQASPVPVVTMPPPVDVAPVRPRPRAALGLPEDRFIFLFSFNPASVTARKNPFGVIEAFRRAFGRAASGPILVIKTHHLDSLLDTTSLARDLRAAIDTVGGRLIEDNLTREQMTGLLDCCDCYVSLHRSEGFGLGMAEAMALGKPVIGTGYSGNTDFMLPDNSWLVRYTLRTITPDDHRYQPELSNIYPAGQVWAEPDIDHAAELMQAVFADPARAAQVGAAAAQHMQRHFSPQAAGARIVERLGAISASTGKWPAAA